jgi:flagellar hook protein FlgE
VNVSISGALSVAVSGLQENATRFSVAANNIVNANSEGYTAQRVQSSSHVAGSGTGASAGGVTATVVQTDQPVDIASEFVSMIQARVGYAADATVIEMASGMLGHLLDIQA